MLGTPAYMAAEQPAGEAVGIDLVRCIRIGS